MDSEKFSEWTNWWYAEVLKVTQENILPIMDNSGGHEDFFDLPGLGVEFLRPNTTHKYQTCDLGLIAHPKIRYRSSLLRHIVDHTIQWNSEEYHFPPIAQNDRWGLRDGYLPHFGDAISMSKDAWAKTERSTILKCWIKS